MKTKIIIFLQLIIFLLFFSTCDSEENAVSCVPKSTISVQIDMTLPAYNMLLNPGGWLYYEGSLSGTRGLIIVNKGNGNYTAYDRNAPHICPTNNSTLVVQNSVTLYCPEDGAKWILTTGQPVEIADRRPITYYATASGNILMISN